jgi:hypothetical protein
MSKISEDVRMQDCWSRLVEECRIGTVYRPIFLSNRTTFDSHKPHVELSQVPIFYWGEMQADRDDAEVDKALQAIQTGAIKLPYERVAFMYHVSSDNPTLHRGPAHRQNHNARVYVMIVEEEDDGSITIFSFYWHYTTMDHWVKQCFQARVTCGSDAQMEFAFHPDVLPHVEFMARFQCAIEHMILNFLADWHRLMTHKGSVTFPLPGKETQRINLRRSRLKLPDVSAIRIIKLGDLVLHVAPSAPSAPGAMKRPHFRKGTYRTLATGRRIWVRAMAIHGGGGDPPPWYEIR